MSKLILSLISLMLLSNSSYAKRYDVKCYSADKLIFSQVVDDVRELDGLLVLKNNNHITFTNGDCVIEYLIPVHDKKK